MAICARLTDLQHHVIERISLGMADKGIAAELGMTLPQTKKHVRVILARLELPNRAAAAAWWEREHRQA